MSVKTTITKAESEAYINDEIRYAADLIQVKQYGSAISGLMAALNYSKKVGNEKRIQRSRTQLARVYSIEGRALLNKKSYTKAAIAFRKAQMEYKKAGMQSDVDIMKKIIDKQIAPHIKKR